MRNRIRIPSRCFAATRSASRPRSKIAPDTGQQLRRPTRRATIRLKSPQGGKEEPSSQTNAKAAATNTEVLVDGRLAVPGSPADSQTVPAKFSARNARLDELPIMALPLGPER